MKTWKTWGVVGVSALLIALSWLSPAESLIADALMIAAAVVAGWNIAISTHDGHHDQIGGCLDD